MKSILLIGVGGTGSAAVDILYQKIKEFGNQTDNHISAIVFDTDAGCVSTVRAAEAVSMADSATVGTICDRIGSKYLREWFPCDTSSVRAQEMVRGASQWRKKSFLAFLNLMNRHEASDAFHRALDELVTSEANSSYEIYLISSIAGGTGSGSFIPIALYAQRYLREMGKEPLVSAMIACPDIYADTQTPENRIKIYANAYAILRELNAINLVTNSEYNRTAATSLEKKAPVCFRIGHPDEPSVGVLFDASDEKYWHAEFAPFSQIFMLDKIPGVQSIRAHEVVLANSLYTILCTDMGSVFDSATSNLAFIKSQNNGSNAIYAGISTAQVSFPSDSILDYLAYKKAFSACEGEWLVLHDATEERIHEEEMRKKEMRRQFTMKDGDYAKYFLSALQAEESTRTSNVASLVERCTTRMAEDEKRIDVLDEYYQTLISEITARIDNGKNSKSAIDAIAPVQKPRLFGGDVAKRQVLELSSRVTREINRYFSECVETVCDSATGIAEAILTFDERKDKRANAKLSLVENILMRDGKYIHPVAAMVQLCRLKVKLCDFLTKNGASVWMEVKTGEAIAAPSQLLNASQLPIVKDTKINSRKSAYCKMGALRITELQKNSDAYMKMHTCPVSDDAYLRADAMGAFDRIYKGAGIQLQIRVLEEINRRVDALIQQYRAFFTRFSGAKKDFAEAVKTAHKRDAGRADSVIHIFSSMEEKDSIMKQVFGRSGAEDMKDLLESEHVAGESVFDANYISAIAEYNQESAPIPGNIYRRLFESMVASYRKTIGKTTAYRDICGCNVIQAIEMSMGKGATTRDVKAKMKSIFSYATEVAKPSLQVDMTPSEDDKVVNPVDVLAVMMSYETAKYIKMQADFFDLKITGEDMEESAIRSCAEQFAKRYIHPEARISIVNSIPDQVLYITGERRGISPIRVPKFDELSANPVYFRNYQKAIENARRFESDMWNPHLGNNLHKRGYLPYMNTAMEDICDEKLVKAMIFGITSKKIRLGKGKSKRASFKSFRYVDAAGAEKIILTANNDCVNMKNVAELFAWLRNEDQLINEWSDGLDAQITKIKTDLTNIVSDSDVGKVKGELTASSFIKTLHSGFFAGDIKKNDDLDTKKKAKGLGVIDFAYAIKASEESSRDCDDADRLLKVTSKIFTELCRAKTSNPEHFADIYEAQLNNLYGAFAASYAVRKEKADMSAYFSRVVQWVNGAGAYRMIPESRGINADGSVNYVDYTPSKDVRNALTYVPPIPGAEPERDEEAELYRVDDEDTDSDSDED